MVAIDVTFQNSGDSTLNGIRTGSAQLQSGMKMNADVNIKSLTVGSSHPVAIGIDFNDTLQPAKFEIRYIRVCGIYVNLVVHVYSVRVWQVMFAWYIYSSFLLSTVFVS